MCRQGNATPGEYASERSSWVASALVAATASFPGCPSEWKRSASSSLTRMAVTSLVDTGVSPCNARGKPQGAPSWLFRCSLRESRPERQSGMRPQEGGDAVAEAGVTGEGESECRPQSLRLTAQSHYGRRNRDTASASPV